MAYADTQGHGAGWARTAAVGHVWVSGPAAAGSVLISVARVTAGGRRNHAHGNLRALLSLPWPSLALGQLALPLFGHRHRKTGPPFTVGVGQLAPTAWAQESWFHTLPEGGSLSGPD